MKSLYSDFQADLCLFDVMLYVNAEQLRSCWDGHLLNHTIPGQASHKQFTSAHSFASNSQLALLELVEEGNYFSTNECAGRQDRARDCCLRSGHTTDRATMPGKVPTDQSLCSVQKQNILLPLSTCTILIGTLTQ